MKGLLHSNIVQGGAYKGNTVATAAACVPLDKIDKGALNSANAHDEQLIAGIGKILF